MATTCDREDSVGSNEGNCLACCFPTEVQDTDYHEEEGRHRGRRITGACAARRLSATTGAAVEVHLFDQGRRGVGGRTSSRTYRLRDGAYRPSAGGECDDDDDDDAASGSSQHPQELRFDHGCQFFRADTPRFKRLAEEWIDRKYVAEWECDFRSSAAATETEDRTSLLKKTAFSYASQDSHPFNPSNNQPTAATTCRAERKREGARIAPKKEATRTADLRSLWEPTILRNNDNATTSSCEHMLAVLPRIPQEGPAISFMNCLAGEGFFDKATSFAGNNPVDVCFGPLVRFPEVRKQESERSLAMNLLLRFVRNVIVRDSRIEGEKWFHNHLENEVAICRTINALGILGTYSDLAVAKRRANKVENRLMFGNRRDLVKFAAKRLPCACLKELRSDIRKKVTKVGTCFGCGNEFPRSELHVCTGCMIAEYCSKGVKGEIGLATRKDAVLLN